MPRTRTPLTIANIREHIVGVDARVPLLDGSSRTYVNFDNAATTPALRPVMECVDEFLGWYSSVHRGAGYKSQLSTRIYEQTREIVLDFVGADPERYTVIYGKNSTEALNKVARGLHFAPGDVILTSLMEHHSNLLPWRGCAQVVHIEPTVEGGLDESSLDALLEQYAGRVRLVAITGASNVTGTLTPYARVAAKAHAAGARFCLDAAQLAPHHPIRMCPANADEQIDFLVFSGHKLYAPFGIGALVCRRDALDNPPVVVGGGTVRFVTPNSADWSGLPDREEAGSPNVVGAVATAKALRCLKEIGMEAVHAHECELTAYLLSQLALVPRVRIYGIADPARVHEKVDVVPFEVEGMSHVLVAAILSAEAGVAVRNGTFCAQPYVRRLLGLSETQIEQTHQQVMEGSLANLPGLVRVSFGLYNTREEIDWFIENLHRVVTGQYRGAYHLDSRSGDYRAAGWNPDFTSDFSLQD
jgi:selenocysteine lyase/cysteine desulfurase